MQSYLKFLRDNAHWLGAAALLSFASCFGQTFVVAVFAGQIRAEFGLTDGEWAGFFSLGTLASGGLALWAGTLTDRVRARWLGAATLAGLAGACLLLATSRTPWMLPVALFGLRFFAIGMATHIAAVSMTRWFVASRGRALSISMLGFAAGEALLPVSLVLLNNAYGWRVVWVLAAGLMLALIPALVALLRTERTPQSVATETPAFGIEGRHWMRREVMGHWLFWMVIPALLAPWALSSAFFFHQLHLAQDRGWPQLALAALFPLYTASWITTSMLTGWMVDRLGARRLMPWYLLSYAAAFAVLGLVPSLWGAAFGLICLGIGAGAHSAIPTIFWAEVYGTGHLGAVRALAAAFMLVGSSVGPVLTGWLIDQGVPFADQAVWMAGWFIATSALLGLAGHWLRRGSGLSAQK